MSSRSSLTVGAAMTADPITINGNARLSEAARLMDERGIHHLPVVINGVVESIVSDRDIRRFLLPGHKLSRDEEPLVRDICPVRIYLADMDDPLDRILDAMVSTGIGAVPVLRHGELAGIFTRHDACRVLAEQLRR